MTSLLLSEEKASLSDVGIFWVFFDFVKTEKQSKINVFIRFFLLVDVKSK